MAASLAPRDPERHRLSQAVFSGVAAKLSLIVLLISLVATSLLTAYDYFHHYATNYADLTRLLEQHVDVGQCEVLRTALWNEDWEQVRVQLSGIIKAGDITCAQLDLPDRPRLSFGDCKQEELLWVHKRIVKNFHGEDVFLGDLRVGGAISRMRDLVRERIVSTFIYNGALIFLVLAVFHLLVILMVTRHVNRLARQCESMDIRHLDTPFSLARPQSARDDEFDQLVCALNGLRAGIAEHLAERERAALSLTESESRWRTLVANLPGAVYRCNLTHPWTMHYVSFAIESLTGYPAETFYSEQSVTFGNLILEEDREMVNREVEAAVRQQRAYDLEYRLRHKDGRLHWVHDRGRALYDGEGKAIYLDGVFLDITDKARLREQFEQAQKMEAVGRLAGGVAHDFNNLLTGIQGNVSLALMDMNEHDPLAANLRDVMTETKRASDLVRQLLAFSRKQIIAPKILDLNTVVNGMRRLLERVLGEDIILEVALAEPLSAVRADPSQLEQLIVNMAVNARDAMPHGGRLVLETIEETLDDAYHMTHMETPPGHYVRLSISDTGIGITKEALPHIFEPFFSTKPIDQGSGLGLATVFGIVKQHGGSIEVYSEPHHGTTFKIYLPAVEASEEPTVPHKPDEWPGGHETLLLVEDEPGVRHVAERVLSRLGYHVLVATSGGEACLLADEYHMPIHLLLTDVVLPGLNGREVAQHIALKHPETRILYTSGYTENVIAHHGVLDENVEFLPKPYTPPQLAQHLRLVLDSHRPT